MTGFIDTRAAANKEFKAIVRSAKRRGDALNPEYAAKVRRFDANLVLNSAHMWRDKGDLSRALYCYAIARGHFIVARQFDRMAACTK